MLVSIIIPLYNSEKYIQRTVESALAQSHEDLEVIVVDDGSKDLSADIVNSIMDNRLRYVYQKNGGVSSARNHGFKLCKGEYITFLDSDDILHEKSFEEKVKYAEANPCFGLVHGHLQVIDTEFNFLDDIQKGKEGWILEDLLKWEENCVPSPSSAMIRRSVLEEVGGFDTDLSTAADQEFYFRVAEKYQIGMVDMVLGYYRMHDANMHSNIRLMETDHILTYKKAKVYNFFKSKSFENKCFANLYKIIGASYWKNEGNKIKGIEYLLKALFRYPKIFFK
jgi:glycosyltransferase involved in cell wall biosynthesis